MSDFFDFPSTILANTCRGHGCVGVKSEKKAGEVLKMSLTSIFQKYQVIFGLIRTAFVTNAQSFLLYRVDLFKT